MDNENTKKKEADQTVIDTLMAWCWSQKGFFKTGIGKLNKLYSDL